MSAQVLARRSDAEGRLLSEPVSTSVNIAETAIAATQEAPAMVPLTRLGREATGIVAGVRVAPPGSIAPTDPALERMALRLIEIGFVQGAQLRVIAFGQPGGDPIGVRVGGRGGVSTFALRRQEAACVWVWPDAKPPKP